VPIALAAAVLFAAPLGNTVVTHADPGGGTVIEGNFAGDPKTFNPLLVQDQSSQLITGFLFPSLLGVDAKTGGFAPNMPGGLALSWTVSDDSKTYTIKLRQGLKWSDGKDITAQDVQYTWDATIDPQVGSPNSVLWTKNGGTIDSIKATDDYTVEVKFSSADCTALNNIGLVVVPAHIYKADHSDVATSAYNTNPTVTWGPFKFQEFVPSERVSLVANPDYPDAIDKTVKPEGFIYKNVTNQTVSVDQFIAGESNIFDTPPASRRADIAKASDTINIFKYAGDSWEHLVLNEDDPSNPQPGVDKDGKPVAQGHHPLFGDVRVRQAIAKGLDVEAIIKTGVQGEATRMASTLLNTSWAHDPNLKPIAFDQAAAKKLLDDAGFPVGPDGKTRVAKGAKYAKDGTALKFTLIYFSSNARRTAVSQIIKSQLEDIGFQVDLSGMDFNTQIDTVNSEKYDAAIEVLGTTFPADPGSDLNGLYTPGGDVLGAGNLNVTSYSNPQVADLLDKARTVPGCARDARAKLYQQAEKILQDDEPIIYLYSLNGEYDALKTVKGFDPKPWPSPPGLYWNIDSWTVVQKAS